MSPILKIGRGCVALLDPDPATIDLRALEQNLWTVHRFSNNRKALKVRQHTALAAALARRANEPREVIDWCAHHDDHEGIIGDIPGPLKSWINTMLGGGYNLDVMESFLDRAICVARGATYPDASFRKITYHYDKLAETLEWLFVLDQPREVWNKPYENWINEDQAREWVAQAASLLPPAGLFD